MKLPCSAHFDAIDGQQRDQFLALAFAKTLKNTFQIEKQLPLLQQTLTISGRRERKAQRLGVLSAKRTMEFEWEMADWRVD